MSFLVLFLAFGLCLAGKTDFKERVFRSGREYRYVYEGQILSGIPGASKLYAGVKLRTEVRLQFQPNNKVTMKLEKVDVRKINEHVMSPTPSVQLPIESFSQLRPEETQLLITMLSKPVEFRYEQGEVKDLQVASNDEFWSVNVKKGLLNLLHLNLDERKALVDNDDILLKNALPKLNPSQSLYRVMEEGIDGLCESIYVISPRCIGSKCSVTHGFMVTKTRDYTRCQSRPTFAFGMWSGMKCPTCKQTTKDVLQEGCTIRYTILGDRHHFLIESAVLESQFMFTPYSKDAGSAITFVKYDLRDEFWRSFAFIQIRQLLIFEKTETLVAIDAPLTKDVIPVPKNLIRKPECLKLELPAVDEFFSKVSKPITSQDAVEHKKRLVGMMVDAIVQRIKTDEIVTVPKLTTQLISLLRTCNKPELTAIFEQYCKTTKSMTKEMVTVRNIFLDVLPVVGTMPSVDVIIQQVMAKEIEPVRATEMFTSLSMLTTVNEDIVSSIVLFATKMPSLKMPLFFQRSVWLCTGSLMNSYVSSIQQQCKLCPHQTCNQCPQMKKKLSSMLLFTEKWGKILTKQFDQCTTDVDRITILKTIGNAGIIETLPLIEKLVMSGKVHVPLPVRVQAVYALRKMAPKMPHKVHSLCLPIVMDPVEHHEVRIACYIMTMRTNPTVAMVQMIAQSLAKERSLQVASFIYTHLTSMANTTKPCLHSLAQKCKLALMFARPYNLNMQFSRKINTGFFSDYLQTGLDADISIINDLKSVLPRAGVVSVTPNFFGYSMNFFEAGFRAEGLQNLVDKYFDSSELKAFFGDFLTGKITHTPEHFQATLKTKIPKEQKVKTTPRVPDELKGSIYLKAFGKELSFIPFNKHSLADFLDWAKFAKILKELEQGKTIDYTKALVMNDATLMLPTTMGFPLKLHATVQAITTINGNAKLTTVTPKRALKEATLTLNCKPRTLLMIEGCMGIDATLFKTGIAVKSTIQSAVPISTVVSLNVDKQLVKLTVAAPEQERKLVQLQNVPQIFFEYSRRLPSEVLPTVILRELGGEEVNEPFQTSYKFGRKQIGLELEVIHRAVDRTNKPFCPFHPMCCKQVIEIVTRPGVDEPRQIVVSALLKNENTVTSPLFPPKKGVKSDVSEEQVDGSWWSEILSYSKDWISDSQEIVYPTPAEPSSSSEEEVETERLTLDRIPLLAKDCSRYEMLFSVKTKGCRRERENHVQFVYQRTADHNLRKFDVQFVCDYCRRNVEQPRSWLSSDVEAPKGLKIKLEGRMENECPSKAAPMSEWVSAKIESGFKLTWETTSQKQINFKAVVSKSPEQIRLMQSGLEQWADYKQCMLDKDAGLKYSLACEIVKTELHSLRMIKVHTLQPFNTLWDEILPTWSKTTLKMVYRQMTQMTHRQMYFIENPPMKTMTAQISLQKDNRQVDLQFGLYPTETLVLNGLMSPLPLPHISVKPIDVMPSILVEHSSVFMKTPFARSSSHPQCLMSKNRLVSFDGSRLPIPSTSCQLLLAKDCSEMERFSVVVEPLSSLMKKVLVVTDDVRIHLMPRPHSGPVVLINDQPLTVPTASKQVVIRKDMTDPTSPVVAVVTNKFGEMIVSCKSGVEIITDCKDIKIKVSPIKFPGKTCGVCGNNNGEVSDDMEGPDMMKHSSPEALVASYLLPTETCDAKKIKLKHKLHGGECVPILNRVVRRRIDNDGLTEICISAKKYPVCPESCKAVESSYIMHANFFCVHTSPSIEEMIEQQQLEELASLCLEQGVEKRHHVPKAESCVPLA